MKEEIKSLKKFAELSKGVGQDFFMHPDAAIKMFEYVEELQSRLEALDKDVEKEIKERDYREEVIDKILDMVLGEGRAEWSSNYGFEDAIIDVESASFCIKQMVLVRERCLLLTGGAQQQNSVVLFFKDRIDAHSFLKSIDRLTNTALQASKETNA